MAAALYGPGGFFVRPDTAPADHFRTSALASPHFAAALARLLARVDLTLGHPDRLDVVDVGAGRGELLAALVAAVPTSLRRRLCPVAVEVAPPPATGPTPIWTDRIPERVTGLLIATEWLDNVPLEVAQRDDTGVVRYVLVDPATGEETLGEPVTGSDADWLDRWWPLTEPGQRAEIGLTRDQAWAGAVRALHRGVALAVDYGHVAGARPPLGTLTGFRHGREVAPVPDGSCDLTAHVAMDAVAASGAREAAAPLPADRHAAAPFALHTNTHRPPGPVLTSQRRALRALGLAAGRPPLHLAHTDPAAYLRALAGAGEVAELTDPTGLGGHYWLLQPVGVDVSTTLEVGE